MKTVGRCKITGRLVIITVQNRKSNTATLDSVQSIIANPELDFFVEKAIFINFMIRVRTKKGSIISTNSTSINPM